MGVEIGNVAQTIDWRDVSRAQQKPVQKITVPGLQSGNGVGIPQTGHPKALTCVAPGIVAPRKEVKGKYEAERGVRRTVSIGQLQATVVSFSDTALGIINWLQKQPQAFYP
jgi:hypothetical protein